jgi:hypothetical protein
MGLNPWQVLSGQVTQSVTGWNFEEQLATKLTCNGGCIVPSNPMSDVVREILGDSLSGTHSSCIYVGKVDRFRIFHR